MQRDADLMTIRRWRPGDTVLYRSMIIGRPLVTIAVTVVADEPDLLVLYRPTGAPYRELVTDEGHSLPRVMRPDAVHSLSGREMDGVWPHGPSLLLTPTGAAHAILLNWSADWVFQRWYVNLQQPTGRTDDGFQMTDQFLDIVVQPDGDWDWKDDDELEEAVLAGRLTDGEAREVRHQGERIVADVTAGRTPFDGAWQNWRPDLAWSMPTVPDDLPESWP